MAESEARIQDAGMLPTVRCTAAPFPLRRVKISTPTHPTLATIRNRPDSAEFSCQGMSVMGNIFPLSSEGQRISAPRPQCEDDSLDGDLDTDVIALLEENARLRALVTKLSDLVLRHVVGGK
jgi:hypothetical protein